MSTPDGEAIAVLGIPTGTIEERFQPARTVAAWNGVRESAQGPVAWQDGAPPRGASMSERDCLSANVWLPADRSGPPRAVLVWVHGGAHLYGSNADPLCDGARLAAAHGIIVVAVSYRLGAFGHLRVDHLLGDMYRDAANVALHDILGALEWVKREVGAFGGDPTRVTLMGQSAGGVAVASLLAEAGEDPPFRRAIVESATAERVHSLTDAAEVTDELLAELAGPVADPDPEILLRASAADVVEAQERVVARWRSRGLGPATPFRPVTDFRLIHDVPLNLIAAGAGSNVDMLIGTNRNEASAYVDLLHLDDATAAASLAGEIENDATDVSVADYVTACLVDDGVSPSPAEALESYVADRLYRRPIGRLLDARSTAEAGTFAYLFAWSAPDTREWARRSGHSIELPFVFRHLDDSDTARNELGAGAPGTLSEYMSEAWAAFVETGTPVVSNGPTWPPYGSDRSTLVLDESLRVVDDPFAARYRRAPALHPQAR